MCVWGHQRLAVKAAGNGNEAAAPVSVNLVYFCLTSVHPRGNLTSSESDPSPLALPHFLAKRLRLYQ